MFDVTLYRQMIYSFSKIHGVCVFFCCSILSATSRRSRDDMEQEFLFNFISFIFFFYTVIQSSISFLRTFLPKFSVVHFSCVVILLEAVRLAVDSQTHNLERVWWPPRKVCSVPLLFSISLDSAGRRPDTVGWLSSALEDVAPTSINPNRLQRCSVFVVFCDHN